MGKNMSKRGELLKACLEREFSYDMIIKYTSQIKAAPEEQKESLAEALTAEIIEKFPLIRNDTNYTK